MPDDDVKLFGSLAEVNAFLDTLELPEGVEMETVTTRYLPRAEKPVPWAQLNKSELAGAKRQANDAVAARIATTPGVGYMPHVLYGFNDEQGYAIVGAAFWPKPGQGASKEAMAAEIAAAKSGAARGAAAERGAGPGTNTGHGHVWKRPDGVVARCGGPAMCKECALDEARHGAAPVSAKPGVIPQVSMSGQRMLVSHDDAPPVMLVLKDGRLTMHELP